MMVNTGAASSGVKRKSGDLQRGNQDELMEHGEGEENLEETCNVDFMDSGICVVKGFGNKNVDAKADGEFCTMDVLEAGEKSDGEYEAGMAWDDVHQTPTPFGSCACCKNGRNGAYETQNICRREKVRVLRSYRQGPEVHQMGGHRQITWSGPDEGPIKMGSARLPYERRKGSRRSLLRNATTRTAAVSSVSNGVDIFANGWTAKEDAVHRCQESPLDSAVR